MTFVMNKKAWFIPIIIVAVNILAIAVRWGELAEVLPAHFDLEGNASSTMPRNTLLMYPLIAAAICLIAYVMAHLKNKLQNVLIILSSGISLILFLSTMVTLTSGSTPVFLLAEPVVFLASIVAAIISIFRSRKLHR